MSKHVKQMEMDVLKDTFQGVRNLVVLTASGLTCQADNQMRLALRKKNIHLQMVKNSLTRRVFGDLDIRVGNQVWEGPTLLAWGANSIAELSRELDAFLKKNAKIKVKSAVAEGQEVTFRQALEMPTREEAIAQVLALILGPAAQIAGQIIGPAAQIAGQIQTISEKEPAADPAEAAPPPTAG
jgi:large subunit ribosomal protein L10